MGFFDLFKNDPEKELDKAEALLDKLARQGEELTTDQEKAIVDPIVAKYEHEGHAFYSSSRLWDDGVIDPVDTRTALSLALGAATNRLRERETPLGIFRM